MKKAMWIALVIGVLVFSLIGCDTTGTDDGSIVCFGDSLTEGYGASKPGSVDRSKSYPAFLQSKVKTTVANAGISGDTAAGGLARAEKDVLSKNPRLVIILLGANDFFRLRPANETKADLQAIINKLRDGNRKIYLASFIGNAAWESSIFEAIPGLTNSELAALLPDYKKMFTELQSENRDLGFISDIWTGVWGIHMSDPIHPDAAGYSIMADNIFNAIKPYLAENDLIK
jgi:acyl-CoA thioesterase-1